MAFLGIDLGSSNCKAVVWSEEGKELSKTNIIYPPPLRPQDKMAEMPADIFFNAFVKVINAIAPAIRADISALAISSHGESYIALDTSGDPIGNFILNSDNRAVEESLLLEKELGREYLYSVCGVPPHQTFSLTKIFWHKRRGMYDNAARFLSVGDFMLYKLGFDFVTDFSSASRVMGFDIVKRQWADDILKAAGVGKNEFPLPVEAGTEAGKLPLKSASILGLKPGISICVGGHDQPCGALGMGILGTNEAMVSAGTYECIAVSTETPCNNERAYKCHINSYCHVVPEKFITLAFFPGAMVIDWLVKEYFPLEIAEAKESDKSPYTLLDKKTEEINGPTGIYFTPHLIGSLNPDWDIRAKTVIAGLRPETTRYHLYKAAYEGIACELARNVEVLEEITGYLNMLRISGGWAKLDLSLSLIAALTKKPVMKMESEESVCLGAAILAGIGSGAFKDYKEATGYMLRPGEIIKPDLQLGKEYEKQQACYNSLLPLLSKFWSICNSETL